MRGKTRLHYIHSRVAKVAPSVKLQEDGEGSRCSPCLACCFWQACVAGVGH